MPLIAATYVGIACDDVAARARKLAKKKVELVVPEPTEFPGGKFIAARDPAGNVVEMLQFTH